MLAFMRVALNLNLLAFVAMIALYLCLTPYLPHFEFNFKFNCWCIAQSMSLFGYYHFTDLYDRWLARY